MRKILCACALAILAIAAAKAEESLASEALAKELLGVMNVRSLMETQAGQMDAMLRASMQKSFANISLNDRQKKILDDRIGALAQVMRQQIDYGNIEPRMLLVYRRSFTDKEISDMLVFYRSDAGKAVIEKMPRVMQETMQVMQSMMQDMQPEMQKWQKETIEELKAAK